MSAPPNNLHENQLATIYVPPGPPAHPFRQSLSATHGASTLCRTYDPHFFQHKTFWGHVPSAADPLRIADHVLLALKPPLHLPTIAPSTAFGVKFTQPLSMQDCCCPSTQCGHYVRAVAACIARSSAGLLRAQLSLNGKTLENYVKDFVNNLVKHFVKNSVINFAKHLVKIM